MSAVELLQHNLHQLVSANSDTAISAAETVGVTLETILCNPIAYRKQLKAFLEKFELSIPSLMNSQFNPPELAKFKKANNENVSMALIENLKNIGMFFREKEAIEKQELREFSNEYTVLNKVELIQRVFEDINFHQVRSQLSSLNPQQRTYAFQSLLDNIFNAYGLKIFLVNDESNPLFNFDGVYFDKPIAVAFVKANYSFYGKTLFTILHELYHFLKDDGESNTFDLFDFDDYQENMGAEDVRANNFAIEFLLYGAESEITSFKRSQSLEDLCNIINGFHVSRQALGNYLKMDLSSFRTGRLQGSQPFAKSEIKDILAWHYAKDNISIRRIEELLKAV